jgi:hypothetical protein
MSPIQKLCCRIVYNIYQCAFYSQIVFRGMKKDRKESVHSLDLCPQIECLLHVPSRPIGLPAIQTDSAFIGRAALTKG